MNIESRLRPLDLRDWTGRQIKRGIQAGHLLLVSRRPPTPPYNRTAVKQASWARKVNLAMEYLTRKTNTDLMAKKYCVKRQSTEELILQGIHILIDRGIITWNAELAQRVKDEQWMPFERPGLTDRRGANSHIVITPGR